MQKKTKNVNEISDVAALSWTSEEKKDDELNASEDLNVCMLERANFEAARSQVANWIASIRNPMRQSVANQVIPSHHPM